MTRIIASIVASAVTMFGLAGLFTGVIARGFIRENVDPALLRNPPNLVLTFTGFLFLACLMAWAYRRFVPIVTSPARSGLQLGIAFAVAIGGCKEPAGSAPPEPAGAVDFGAAIELHPRYDAAAHAIVVEVSIAPGFHAYAEGETVGRPLKLEVAGAEPIETLAGSDRTVESLLLSWIVAPPAGAMPSSATVIFTFCPANGLPGVALTVESAAMAGVPIAGTNWIPGRGGY